ncbi:hypothetical protein TI05_10115 [Achromatium sp. WMS3]|nr:hypothetical protein TI05_10115 [Achromatium sp. WMS3]
MLNTKQEALTYSFLNFASQSYNILHIESEQDYQEALENIEHLFEQVSDNPNDILHDLIDILARAVEKYELKQKNIILFEKEVAGINQEISMLRVLMDQYNLTIDDLNDEIGSKLVPLILNGKKHLTKEQILKLAQRFNISPALFFDLK